MAAWRHSDPHRSAIFVGDFIDRGPGQLQTIGIVRSMLDTGSAQAVMGNHEFNAVAWHTPGLQRSGQHLRKRSDKNQQQPHAFLIETEHHSALHQDVVDWLLTLPVWLDLRGLRIGHACWDSAHIAVLATQLLEHNALPSLATVLAAVLVAASAKAAGRIKSVGTERLMSVASLEEDGDVAYVGTVDAGAQSHVPGDYFPLLVAEVLGVSHRVAACALRAPRNCTARKRQPVGGWAGSLRRNSFSLRHLDRRLTLFDGRGLRRRAWARALGCGSTSAYPCAKVRDQFGRVCGCQLWVAALRRHRHRRTLGLISVEDAVDQCRVRFGHPRAQVGNPGKRTLAIGAVASDAGGLIQCFSIGGRDAGRCKCEHEQQGSENEVIHVSCSREKKGAQAAAHQKP